jgi:hypothetical protein
MRFPYKDPENPRLDTTKFAFKVVVTFAYGVVKFDVTTWDVTFRVAAFTS